jgi:hypothetical protein
MLGLRCGLAAQLLMRHADRQKLDAELRPA